MKPAKPAPERVGKRTDPARAEDGELIKIRKRIKALEKSPELCTMELELLKKRSGTSGRKSGEVCVHREDAGTVK